MITTAQQLMVMQYSSVACPECGRMIRRIVDASKKGLTLNHEEPSCEAFRVFVEDVVPGYADFFMLFLPDQQS